MNSKTALVSAALATALLAACSSSSRSTQAAAPADPCNNHARRNLTPDCGRCIRRSVFQAVMHS